MPLKITYWTGSKSNPNIAGAVISSESLTISGTSARVNTATPDNAVYVSVSSTETGAFDYSGATSTAIVATSAYISAGERIWLDAVPGYKVAGIQA